MRFRLLCIILIASTFIVRAQDDADHNNSPELQPQHLLLMSTGAIQPAGTVSISLHELTYLHIVHSPFPFLEYDLGFFPITRDLNAGVKVPLYAGSSAIRSVAVGLETNGYFRNKGFSGKYFLPTVSLSSGSSHVQAHLSFSAFRVEDYHTIPPEDRNRWPAEDDGYRGEGERWRFPAITQVGASYFSSSQNRTFYGEALFAYNGRSHATEFKQYGIGVRNYWSWGYVDVGWTQILDVTIGEGSSTVLLPVLSAGMVF